MVSRSNGSISVPRDSIARKLRKSLKKVTVALLSRTELVPSDDTLRRCFEISQWSQCWAVVERNKCQHCKNSSTTAVSCSRGNDSVYSTDACSFWLWQRWRLSRQRAMTVFAVWLLWSCFHYEVHKNSTFTVTEKGGCALKFWFSSSPAFHRSLCVFFPEILLLYLQFHSWIRKSDLLLVFSHLKAAQLMYFSCSSCFMFPGVLVGSSRCEKLYRLYICVCTCMWFVLFLPFHLRSNRRYSQNFTARVGTFSFCPQEYKKILIDWGATEKGL